MPIRSGSSSPRPFGRPQRELDTFPDHATPADLLRLLDANKGRIADGARVARGEVAWLDELLAHPAADASVVAAVRQLVEDVGLSDAAKEAGAQDWFERIGDSSAPEITLPGTQTPSGGSSVLSIRSGEAGPAERRFQFAFGSPQRGLPPQDEESRCH